MDRRQPFDGLSVGPAVAAVATERPASRMHPSRVLLVTASVLSPVAVHSSS